MPELTYNEELRDSMLRHQIGLLLYAGSLRNEVWEILDASEADLREQIRNGLRRVVGKPVTQARQKRLVRLFTTLRATRMKSWTKVGDKMVGALNELALEEPGFVVKILDGVFPVELGAVPPDPAILRSIVKSRPFMGATLSQWVAKHSADDVAAIERAIQIGLTQSETIPQITRRVVGTIADGGTAGVTATTRGHAETLTRTAVNGIASEARDELYLANEDLISGLLFLATLDQRTTPICRGYDGQTFTVKDAPRMPLHWGERSLLSPVVDGEVIGSRPMRNFTERQLLREYSSQNGLSAPTKRDALPHGHKGAFDAFARKRMRELTGTTPVKTTYQQWLKKQSAQFQNDILGPTRAALFRRGGLTLDRFVAPDGREFTLAELAKFDAAAFKKAGLDPTDY